MKTWNAPKAESLDVKETACTTVRCGGKNYSCKSSKGYEVGKNYCCGNKWFTYNGGDECTWNSGAKPDGCTDIEEGTLS